jgi:aspartyl-tRNA(Asn)/glutamyl-tRNA(Gln) amidotransferase subunit A
VVSLPLPQPGALPVGLMLLGRRGDDKRLLRIAAAVELAFAA